MGGLTGELASSPSALGVAGGSDLASLDAAPTTLDTAYSAYLSCTNACFLNLGSKSVASVSGFTCSIPPSLLVSSALRMSTMSYIG